jgi:hypothetical protein
MFDSIPSCSNAPAESLSIEFAMLFPVNLFDLCTQRALKKPGATGKVRMQAAPTHDGVSISRPPGMFGHDK